MVKIFFETIGPQLNESHSYFNCVLKGFDQLLNSVVLHPTMCKQNSQKAQHLISQLAKLVFPGKRNNNILLSIISKLSIMAPKAYLENAFTKNIEKLIKDKNKYKNDAKLLTQAIKNFDILLQVAPYIQLRDNKWDISIQFIKTFLLENNVLQKKAYKFLLVVMNKVHYSFFFQVIEILKDSENIQSFSKPARLAVVKLIWTKMYEEKTLEDIAFSFSCLRLLSE